MFLGEIVSHHQIQEFVSSMRDQVLGDGALASVALIDAYTAGHPGSDPTDLHLERYWQDEWAPQAICAAYEDILGKVEGEMLRVWRSITIDGADPLQAIVDKLRDGEGLGVCWSHERDQAHPHEGSSQRGVTVLMEAQIGVHDIDLEATLRSYTHPDYVGEEEIVAAREASVALISLCRREGWLRRTTSDVESDISLGSLSGQAVPVGPRSDLDDIARILDYQRSSEKRCPGM